MNIMMANVRTRRLLQKGREIIKSQKFLWVAGLVAMKYAVGKPIAKVRIVVPNARPIDLEKM